MFDLAQQSPRGFVLRFVLSMVALPLAYTHLEPLFAYSYLWPLSFVAATLLDLCGVPTIMFSYIEEGFCALQMQRHLFHVEYDCTGVFWLCIYLTTISIYSTTWQAKIRGFLFGIPAFFAYGVIRVMGLGIIGHLMPSWVSFFHIYLMVLLNLGFLIYLWTFWVNRWTLNPSKAS